MSMARGGASVAAGFVAIPVLMVVARTLVATAWPDADVTTFLILNLTLASLAAACAAALTARLAPEPPYLWVLVLAFLVFAGGLVFGIQQMGGSTPDWYLLALPLASGMSIAVGGWAFLLGARRDP